MDLEVLAALPSLRKVILSTKCYLRRDGNLLEGWGDGGEVIAAIRAFARLPQLQVKLRSRQ